MVITVLDTPAPTITAPTQPAEQHPPIIPANTTAVARQELQNRARGAIYKGYLSQLPLGAPGHDLGLLDSPHNQCQYCLAYHWADELGPGNESSSCCKRGDVELLPLQEPPEPLRMLLTSQGAQARLFRKNIRSYNSALSFTSVSYQKDNRLQGAGGITCFQIHGELFHYQGSLEASSEPPCFAQLFFYDPAYAAGIRTARYPQLDKPLLIELTGMLTAYNPFIPIYQTARERLRAQQGDHRILLNPQMRLIIETGADRRRENLPTGEELAAVLPDEYAEASRRDIVLAVRDPGPNSRPLHLIDPSHAGYMALAYVLLFPYGDYGWNYSLELRPSSRNQVRTRLEQRQFYRYRLHVRESFSSLFYGCRLFQQYIVDAFVSCEQTRLQWLRNHQKNIRSDLYQGLTDSLLREDVAADGIGRRIVLPSSFTGGDRFMQQLFQDSMAIVRYFGKPTFFITITANPRWPEITRALLPGQQPTDRPDLIARVFYLKTKELLKDIRAATLGPYAGHLYTIEYQKRTLPHMHLLVFIHSSTKFDTPERIDEVICAELPDPAWDPTGELTDLVTTTMCHGPCGDDNPNAPCMGRKDASAPFSCQKRFPKDFSPLTVVHEDSYPQYRRRNTRTFTTPKPGCPGQLVVRNNRWVVPYNPFLLQKYRCHINVEICATVQAVKYMNKYVYKGADRTTVEVSATDDEIKRFVQGRYIGPPEAFWRIMEYSTHQEWPPVQHLTVHLKGDQPVYFADDASAEELTTRAERARSTLMAFFDYNRDNEGGRRHLYSQFPQFYTWKRKDCRWAVRQKGTAIGRMYHCSPVAGERYYLRLLLTAVRGPQSFEELYSFEGVQYPTYQAACIARGLADNNQEWFECFDEAIIFTVASGLRTLFLTGLRHQLIPDPAAIWERYKDSLCDDLYHRLQSITGFPLILPYPHYDYGLFLLNLGFTDLQRTNTDFGLPIAVFDWAAIHTRSTSRADRELRAVRAAEMKAKLNRDQLSCFNTVVTALQEDPQRAHFYLQGPSGTGKTFLYTTLCYYLQTLGKTVLCIASTGIAALLLPNGRTSHSAFRIPIQLNDLSTSSIKKGSQAARALASVDLIIWDEVPMQHKYCFEVVHRLLVDLRSTTDSILFGGVPVILGGDFAQILPVVPHGSRADTVSACLQRGFIWPQLRQLRLRVNMRVRNSLVDQEFARWIATLPFVPALNGAVPLLSSIQVFVDVLRLINSIYPPELLSAAVRDYNALRGRALLSTLNASVWELNDLIFDRFPGTAFTFNSVESTDLDDTGDGVHQFSVEYLQSLRLPALPPSRLILKVGVPIMLLRNLCPQEGLCNGSRLVVTCLRRHCIQGRILGGEFHGQLRTIPRIKLSSSEEDFPFILTRKQFPVCLSFAVSINKSQGQSFDIVGVDLRADVFTHGQFYVAMSRVTSVSGLRVLLRGPPLINPLNIVYPEVLEAL